MTKKVFVEPVLHQEVSLATGTLTVPLVSGQR